MSPSFDETEGPNLSDEMKAKFALALKGRLTIPTCRDCPSAQGFVQVVEFLIDNHVEVLDRMDKAAQVMEEFLKMFKELDERAMKLRMLGDDGL